jgi:integrase
MPKDSKQKINFTKSRIDALPSPESGRVTYHDTETAGLILVVYPSGAKSFHLYKRMPNSGQAVKPKLGQFPAMSVEAARKAATSMTAEMFKGKNPQEQHKAAQAELTVGQLFDKFISDHARHHCTTWEAMIKTFNRYFGDWRDLEAAELQNAAVQTRINELGSERGIHTANRAFDDLRSAFNWAIKYKHLIGSNPCEGITRFKTRSRERFIRPEEFDLFIEALKTEKNIDFRDYVYLSLFTGARQGNVLAMRWDCIDFDLALWHILITKNKESQTVPLTHLALQVLTDRYEHRKQLDGEWVFPSDSKVGHLVEPKKAWAKFLLRTGLKDLRMHDLRRTLGSYLAMNNQSLHIIGKVLGHKSATATQIYSRLAHDPLRQAMELAQDSMAKGSSILPRRLNLVKPKSTKRRQSN